jgi:hypothetical protein
MDINRPLIRQMNIDTVKEWSLSMQIPKYLLLQSIKRHAAVCLIDRKEIFLILSNEDQILR